MGHVRLLGWVLVVGLLVAPSCSRADRPGRVSGVNADPCAPASGYGFTNFGGAGQYPHRGGLYGTRKKGLVEVVPPPQHKTKAMGPRRRPMDCHRSRRGHRHRNRLRGRHLPQ